MSGERMPVLRNKIFDKSKWMQLPRDVVIGHEVLAQIPAVCADLKLGQRVMLISGTRTADIAGRRVREILSDRYDVREFTAPAITMSVIREAEKAGANVDFFVAVGGGRVIDSA